MRVDELRVGYPNPELRIGFHDRMTVLAGLGAPERASLIDTIQRAATGVAEGAELHFFDSLGRRLIVSQAHGWPELRVEDPTHPGAAPDPLLPTPSVTTLRHLSVVTADEIGLVPRHDPANDTPELAAARADLAALEAELESARAGEKRAEIAEYELAEIEARIRAVEQGRSRREYARVVAALEQVRAEADVMQSGRASVDEDRAILAAGRGLEPAVENWRAARHRREQAAEGFGSLTRLSPEALAEALAIPDHAPEDLERCVADLETAERARDALSTRLFELAASGLPEPSDPAVVDLARCDQNTLWAAHRAVVDARRALDVEQLALGGLGTSTEVEAIVAEIEAAQTAIEAASRTGRRRFLIGIAVGALGAVASIAGAGAFPAGAALGVIAALAFIAGSLLLPRRRVKAAEAAANVALAKVDAESYLGFQLRRVNAMLDPGSRRRLDRAVADHRAANGRWCEIAGAVTPDHATALQVEVQSYAQALRHLGGAAREIEAVRVELSERAGPAAEAARRRLLELCGPYGADDPARAVELVRQRVGVAATARLQARLEQTEHAELQAITAVADVCDHMQVPVHADLAHRVLQGQAAITAAARREQARAHARPASAVEADLARLEQEEAALRRPDWGPVTAADADEPDIDQLRRDRDAASVEARRTRLSVPEVGRLADRQAALARRVAALESPTAWNGPDRMPIELHELHDRLLATLARARHGGADGEALPAIFDEPLLHVPAGHKWDLLDMIERLSSGCQIAYLTDDPYVAAWAKRRADVGAVKYLAATS